MPIAARVGVPSVLLRCSLALSCIVAPASYAQQVDEDQRGAWYMYFYDTRFDNSRWGVQGDLQYRDWEIAGDMEQLMLRSGLTYRPERFSGVYTLGIARVTSGEFGRSSETRYENRIYQEALLPQRIGSRIYLRHRFRYEQRWLQGQSFRTRFRYALFVNVPLNQDSLGQGAWYLSAYNEIFLNGENDIGDDREVDTYDRNRLYGALGYGVSDSLRLQFGYMHQDTDNFDKGQLQLSLHHNF